LPRLGGEAEGRAVHDGDGGEEGELWVVWGAGVEAEAKLPGYFLAEEERRRGEKDVGGL
jgi:hypothetical protein